jgi:hypothetical protein
MKYPVLMLALLALLVGCGGSSQQQTQQSPTPQFGAVAGTWQIALVPAALGPGSSTSYVEASLSQSGADASASGAQQQLAIVVYPAGSDRTFGGLCGATNATDSLAITFQNKSSFTFTLTEGGNQFTGSGTLSADGNSSTGTYQSPAGSGCPDQGTFQGSRLTQRWSANYAGTLNFSGCTTSPCSGDSITAMFSEATNGALTIAWTDNGTPSTYSGFAVGEYAQFSLSNGHVLALVDSDQSVPGSTMSEVEVYDLTAGTIWLGPLMKQ